MRTGHHTVVFLLRHAVQQRHAGLGRAPGTRSPVQSEDSHVRTDGPPELAGEAQLPLHPFVLVPARDEQDVRACVRLPGGKAGRVDQRRQELGIRPCGHRVFGGVIVRIENVCGAVDGALDLIVEVGVGPLFADVGTVQREGVGALRHPRSRSNRALVA
ncbi:hypothetical protein PJ267_21060 [Arthrobacter sp. OVS8]|nr:hypothetical protein PJ267_21060 [Arthrobacter sp. OVS8]